MIFHYNLNKKKYFFEIFGQTLALLFFVYRTAIPFFKYPFFILQTFLLLYFLKRYGKEFKNTIFVYFKNYKVPIIILGFMIFAAINSNKMYLIIIKDIVNTLIVFIIFCLYGLIISDKDKLKIFFKVFIYSTIGFALIISLQRLLFFNDSVLGIRNIDYNFALIPLFISILGILYIFSNTKYKWEIFILDFILMLLLFTIILSGSRRGLFLIIIMTTLILFIQIYNFYFKNIVLIKLASVTRPFLIAIIFLVLVFYIFFIQTSSQFRNKAIEIISNDKSLLTKNATSGIINRYLSPICSDLKINEIYDKLWKLPFNPKDPESGWGLGNYKISYPLTGRFSYIVPSGTKGYMVDSSCNADSWDNNAYSYTKIVDLKTKLNEKIVASVFCYVSNDFNGTWVRLSSEGNSHGKVVDFYNLNKKGEWQKLSIEPDCFDGNVPIYLYFSKYGNSDFSSLKGYVIFAYPQYEVINKDTNAGKNGNNFLNDNFLINEFDKKEIYKANFLELNTFFQICNIQIQNDKDPIRNFVDRIVNEDTTFVIMENEFAFDFKTRNSLGERTVRWKFALEIYKQEYNIFQKLIGKGFDHLNWYGYYFLNDKTKSDYPHNPFLSILLYSGIIGLLFYLILLYKVFYYYIKYLKDYYLFFIFFLITFFFAFFSGSHPFDPPIMGFFMILPFFIHSVHKKEVLSNKSV